jgi:hypothetical protein
LSLLLIRSKGAAFTFCSADSLFFIQTRDLHRPKSGAAINIAKATGITIRINTPPSLERLIGALEDIDSLENINNLIFGNFGT